jgi:hypothetical protein
MQAVGGVGIVDLAARLGPADIGAVLVLATLPSIDEPAEVEPEILVDRSGEDRAETRPELRPVPQVVAA